MPTQREQAVRFFYKYSGWTGPVGATPAQKRASRLKNARKLARAEAEIERRGWAVRWEEDPNGADSLGDVDPSDVSEILGAVLIDEKGDVLQSLGGITFGHDSVENRRYGRLVEAELASEAI